MDKIWKVAYKLKNDDTWFFLKGKKGFWYADPILFNYSGKKYLFTEAFDMKRQIGRLAISYYENGKFSSPRIIIKRPYHLSYPCVFEHENKVYMIPETGQNRSLELWKAQGDIFKWEKECILLKGVMLADTTVYQTNNHIYLFSYEESEKYITHIYELDIENKKIKEIESLVSVSNTKRPAGKFFNDGGMLYRPVQNNINSYGESILINKILSVVPFKEKEVEELKSNYFFKNKDETNTHTFSQDSDLVVIDFLSNEKLQFYYRIVLIRKIRNMIFKIKAKILNNWRGEK